jgi:16S rRNA (guanine966-N2)-methyltransferase
MNLRILGGQWKGKGLLSPSQKSIRPTSARVRQALFDICQFWIEGISVLDLFSGTGAIGIEALSRGARHATFIEKDPRAIQLLKKRLSKFLISEKDRSIICGEARTEIRRLKKTFDLIYIDPPYEYEDYPALLHQVEQQGLLNLSGALFIEAGADLLNLSPQVLKCRKTHSYGNTILYHFTH